MIMKRKLMTARQKAAELNVAKPHPRQPVGLRIRPHLRHYPVCCDYEFQNMNRNELGGLEDNALLCAS